MGCLVDWLGSDPRSSDEDGTPSKDQPFPRNVHAFAKEFVGQKLDENAKT